MSQVINTNVGALFAGAALNKSAIALQTAQQRLSSGLRINSSKDDATGLANAVIIDSQVRASTILTRNANDAISNAQTYDGYLGQVGENLQRLYEISTQAGGGTVVGNKEADALILENNRLVGLTKDTTTTKVDTGTGTAGVAVTAFTSGAVDVTDAASITTMIGTVASKRAEYGASMGSLASAVAGLQLSSVNLSASYSRIMDTDYAAETTNMTRNNILQQAGTAVLAQANQTPNTVLTLLR